MMDKISDANASLNDDPPESTKFGSKIHWTKSCKIVVCGKCAAGKYRTVNRSAKLTRTSMMYPVDTETGGASAS